jgi:hypothetical protein
MPFDRATKFGGSIPVITSFSVEHFIEMTQA